MNVLKYKNRLDVKYLRVQLNNNLRIYIYKRWLMNKTILIIKDKSSMIKKNFGINTKDFI